MEKKAHLAGTNLKTLYDIVEKGLGGKVNIADEI